MKKFSLFIFLSILMLSATYHKTIFRIYHGLQTSRISNERIKLYGIDCGAQIQDITEKLISDKTIPSDLKQPLITGKRRIIIFKYPSDKNDVAGFMSYFPEGNHPVMIFLRGGNGLYGIMRPNNRFSYLANYNVIGTLYRGNLYGGIDEFGGGDVNDVENLIRFFPKLEIFTHIKLSAPFSMLGVSRGAMEMFISLSRSSYVRSKITRAISVSGNVDLAISSNKRVEMKYLQESKFKESHESSFDDWLRVRNPVTNTKGLPQNLNILLIYGMSDNLVSLDEQNSFMHALNSSGINGKLITVPGATHGFDEKFKLLEKIILQN